MKSFRKFIGTFVCAVILVTTVFSMSAFAMDSICQVTYIVSDNVKDLVTNKEAKETWDVGGDIYPMGYTAEEVTGYEFIGWVVQGNEDEKLPAGWTCEGLTLSFNKDAEGVTPDDITFVAEYKPKELKPSSVLEPDSTKKLDFVNDKKDSSSSIKEDKIDKTSVTVEDETIEAVKTGDTNNSFVWILIGALALVAVIVVVIVLLRNKK